MIFWCGSQVSTWSPSFLNSSSWYRRFLQLDFLCFILLLEVCFFLRHFHGKYCSLRVVLLVLLVLLFRLQVQLLFLVQCLLMVDETRDAFCSEMPLMWCQIICGAMAMYEVLLTKTDVPLHIMDRVVFAQPKPCRQTGGVADVSKNASFLFPGLGVFLFFFGSH